MEVERGVEQERDIYIYIYGGRGRGMGDGRRGGERREMRKSRAPRVDAGRTLTHTQHRNLAAARRSNLSAVASPPRRDGPSPQGVARK